MTQKRLGRLAQQLDGNGEDVTLQDSALPNRGTAGTVAFPASITLDSKGRVTAHTAGSSPHTDEAIQDIVGAMLRGAGLITFNYDDSAGTATFTLTEEQVEDTVGAMVTGNTETGISVTYDDASGKLNFAIDAEHPETVQDIVGGMVTGNTETGINVTYDDAAGKLNFVIPLDGNTLEITSTGLRVRDDGITAAQIANNAVGTPEIADGAVHHEQLGNDAVHTDNIMDGSVTNAKLSDNAVSNGKIQDDAISTDKIQDGAITNAKLAIGSISTNDLEDGSVTTAKLADNAVTNAKIDTAAITSDKIATGAVQNQDLATNSVSTLKIQDGSVTTAKIADNAVTNAKIPDRTITSAKITLQGITAENMGVHSVETNAIADNAVTRPKLSDQLDERVIVDTFGYMSSSGAATANGVFDVFDGGTDPSDEVSLASGTPTPSSIDIIRINNSTNSTGAITDPDITLTFENFRGDMQHYPIGTTIYLQEVNTSSPYNPTGSFILMETTSAPNVSNANYVQFSVTSTGALTGNRTSNWLISINALPQQRLLDGANLKLGSVDTNAIATSAIHTDRINDGAVTHAKLANDSVDRDNFNGTAAQFSRTETGTVFPPGANQHRSRYMDDSGTWNTVAAHAEADFVGYFAYENVYANGQDAGYMVLQKTVSGSFTPILHNDNYADVTRIQISEWAFSDFDRALGALANDATYYYGIQPFNGNFSQLEAGDILAIGSATGTPPVYDHSFHAEVTGTPTRTAGTDTDDPTPTNGLNRSYFNIPVKILHHQGTFEGATNRAFEVIGINKDVSLDGESVIPQTMPYDRLVDGGPQGLGRYEYVRNSTNGSYVFNLTDIPNLTFYRKCVRSDISGETVCMIRKNVVSADGVTTSTWAPSNCDPIAEPYIPAGDLPRWDDSAGDKFFTLPGAVSDYISGAIYQMTDTVLTGGVNVAATFEFDGANVIENPGVGLTNPVVLGTSMRTGAGLNNTPDAYYDADNTVATFTVHTHPEHIEHNFTFTGTMPTTATT